MIHKPAVVYIEIDKNTVFFEKMVKTLFFENPLHRKIQSFLKNGENTLF